MKADKKIELKQWCWEQACRTVYGMVFPFTEANNSMNTTGYNQAKLRAAELYAQVTSE
jgi:hypothetical protein